MQPQSAEHNQQLLRSSSIVSTRKPPLETKAPTPNNGEQVTGKLNFFCLMDDQSDHPSHFKKLNSSLGRTLNTEQFHKASSFKEALRKNYGP